MASNLFLFNLDPDHISCIGGRTVSTCRNCAGNAPRGAICASCNGRGFNIYICVHCNPAAAAAVARSSVHSTASPATANTTPGSSAPSSPGSLSRSPSTSYPLHSDTRATLSWKRYGDGRDRSCGQVEADTPRNL